ncbi:MAG TPA: hypothetical protein VHD32_07070 [Candidatus Didemnitutus sp.]|nr:hypothetical protein [Candidatus Didemnitutus sp.]
MTSIYHHSAITRPPRNLRDLFLRDITSLLVTSRVIARSLEALRPECEFSSEVTAEIDELIGTTAEGEVQVREPLNEAGMILPPGDESAAMAQVVSFFTRLPAGAPSAVLATEVVVNLRLLAQHLELKARLAAEEAMLVGQKAISQALLRWARSWCLCGEKLRAATVRTRVQACVADLQEPVATTAT